MRELTKQQKEVLQNLRIVETDIQRKNNTRRKEKWSSRVLVIKSFEELLEDAYSLILDNEVFSKIERVSPNEANCIIRIYKKENYLAFDTIKLHLYGVYYMPVTSTADYNSIGFSKHEAICCLYNEAIHVPVDFFDVYVKVS